ncbi:hypothetical protein [Sciscionella marina]|uniref:hypothetical protein n=1 Tax=Sciscionella marina TaxID=508770 RepID=UPI0003A8AA6F|nr:hypothetical protein [Sciscionella marina]
MPVWICPTCGAHHPESERPPDTCVVCTDERQWVPPSGQRWTTMAELADAGYATEIAELEPRLTGIGVTPGIGVGQRGVLVRTEQGNLLWDPPAFLDEQAIAAVREAGGLRAVSSSHPHMYGAMADWAREFEAEALLPASDTRWIQRPIPSLRPWSDTLSPLPGVHLVRTGGHFPGSAVLHWTGADGAGVLLCGDTLFVTPGEDRVSFIWSAPNHLPLPEGGVRAIVDTLEPYSFERIYGGWWSPAIRANAKKVLADSARRYLEFLRGTVDIDG